MPEASVHPLRAEAQRLCSGIRRDRADGLYIARGTLPTSPLFLQTQRGEWSVLVPSAEGIAAFSRYLDGPEAFGFAQFCGRPTCAEDIALLCRGIKLLESAAPRSEAALYERAVRERAAVLLRLHAPFGGTLPLCMRIARALHLKSER